jgi:hypothetical protein
MGDMIGILSGLVTLTEVVIRGIKIAKTLYQAPGELTVVQVSRTNTSNFSDSFVLQGQLEHFTDLVKEIHSHHSSSTSSNVAASLTRAQHTIEQLDQLIQVKLLRIVNGTYRARRRAWTRNKSKVNQLRDAIKEHRDNILAAMSSNNL